MSEPRHEKEPTLPAPTGETCPVPGQETPAERAKTTLVRPVLGAVDALYLMFQSAIKSLGMVGPEAGPPPEESTAEGRYAVLPEREGRWPGLRARLPDSAVYAFSVESMFRRAGMWRVLAPLDEVAEELRGAAESAWPSVRERRRGSVLELSFEGGGLTSTIKLSPLEDGTGGAYLSVGQKVGRLRYDEASRLLRGE